MRGAQRKRVKHHDVPGHAHYLTFSCYHGQPFLSLEEPREWLLDALVSARRKIVFDLWAWVIMPEHVHLLVRPDRDVPVSEILRHVKLPVTKRVRPWACRLGGRLKSQMTHGRRKGRVIMRFWQRGPGYDRNLWSAEEIREKIGYVHANPVRRGLVQEPADWRWSSWRAWNAGVDEPIPIDRCSVPPLNG
jgi:putative transposase